MENDDLRSKDRRSFVNYLLSTTIGATLLSIFYPVLEFLVPPPVAESPQSSVDAGQRNELKPNSGKIFKFGTRPGILIRTSSGEYRAFSAICTHLQCTVQYREDLQHIWCACHNGHYDLNGKNIAGPPPRPLEQYNVDMRGEDIIASKTYLK